MSVLMHAVLEKVKSGRLKEYVPLPEIASDITQAFEGVERSSVQVYIVGGQLCEDRYTSLASIFGRDTEKHCFSWHVRQCVKNAGLNLSAESTRLLNCFPGVPSSEDSFEHQARMSGQSFCLVALDLRSGRLVTQSRPDSSDSYAVAALCERSRAEIERCDRYLQERFDDEDPFRTCPSSRVRFASQA